jgi:signal transduction histidine kinase
VRRRNGIVNAREYGGYVGLAICGLAVALTPVDPWFALAAAPAGLYAGRVMSHWAPAVLALALLASAGVIVVALVPPLLVEGTWLTAVAVFAAMLPWLAGRVWRHSRTLIWSGWERAERLEREQRLVSEQVRLRERARIAQDMHDVLGHELSLIALRAGALKLAQGLAEEHRAAAHELRAGAARAVERLGEVVGILREDDTVPPAGRSVADLVDRATAGGLKVELRVEGADLEVPPLVERTVYRVVRECLTNAAKHAPGAWVAVAVIQAADETVVTVDNGAPARDAGTPLPSGGRGLLGLCERVRLMGGSLRYRPKGDGSGGEGFAVEACLPHSVPSVPAEPPSTQAHQMRGRRRVRRAVVLAVVLPVAAFAVLAGSLRVWVFYRTSQAVLDTGDFSRLRVGQSRAEVGHVLPARQAPERPADAGPPEMGTRCAYYAMTANPFDSRAGDVYRLCFRDGVLVAADAVIS